MKKENKYIADLERAIADKYGKLSVQDFRKEWDENKEKEYLSSAKSLRLKKEHFRSNVERMQIGDINIVKRRPLKSADRTCPVCKTYSFSSRDDLYMNRFSTCHRCYEDFICGLEDKWNDGWRPTDKQIADALRRRK
tara:strand:+ start:173 stop:583 length:411 start_codon:yes stop_codon:yes gene_type:complete